MKVNPEIFKSYDIRGIYPKDLNEDVARAFGRGYATLIQGENPGKKLTIVVGNDMRISSPSVTKALIEGLIASGVDVVHVGMVTTPTFYFAVGFYGYDGGVQVSASHNPKEWNGFKIVRAKAAPISGETGIQKIREIIEKEDYVTSNRTGKLSERANVVEEAVKEMQKDYDISKIKPFTIVVDAANSVGALDVEAMFKALPCKIIKLNFKLDGTFPVHEADPLKEENLKLVQEAVLEHNADLGISPDGDGDRYFFVDNKGELVRQEILRGIMAQIALEEHPGETVCYDIRPGRITRDMIEEAGGRAVVTPVGHSLIKGVMIKENAVFGGESSGHYFYRYPFGTFESPIALVTKFLIYLSQQNKSFSEVLKPYKKYVHSGEINSEVSDVKNKIEEIKKAYDDGNQNYLDGVTVEYDDWWFNVRGSNTEPKIRLNLEAKTKELMEEKRDEVLGLIRK